MDYCVVITSSPEYTLNHTVTYMLKKKNI